MTASPAGRRRPPLALALVLLALIAAAVWLLLRDRDGLGAVREVDGVQQAVRDGDHVTIAMRPAGAGGITDVLKAVPEEIDEGQLRAGPAVLRFDRRSRPQELAADFAPLTQVRAAARELELDGSHRIQAVVARPADAVVLAQEIVRRRAAAKPAPSTGDLSVRDEDDAVGDSSLIAARLVGSRPDARFAAALAAAAAVPDRDPEIASSTSTTILRVTAPSAAGAGAAWREVRAALRRSGAAGSKVQVYLDRSPESGEPRPVLSGAGGDDPAAALRVLAALGRAGEDAYVETGLDYAEVDVASVQRARVAATAARAAGVKRITVSWKTLARSGAWSRVVPPGKRDRTSVSDSPAAVLALLPGIARARSLGIGAVNWTRQPRGGEALLGFTRPGWIGERERLVNEPAKLRRLLRAARAIGWRGTANLRVLLGPGSCDREPASGSVAELSAKSAAPTVQVRPASGCADDDALVSVRGAWTATAG